ncbi:hypothetical protein Nepgr_011132 [Nepenthes gracilis]|uniref:MSP domain-containing protein n=1 Tax=Nepenthes gracilis TaxID=150966 RepID=A0AAD3SEI3_NEPGR|nr:hypothetical protein Nepgr_011132 [Nepenthes gracilis]
MSDNKPLIYVEPEELKFQFELEKPSYCDLKVSNNTKHHVAFKVKTTSPKKYFVRPNTGVIHPWDSCVIRVTHQAQREYPQDMQCKDKFLLQSTIVSPNRDVDDLPPDTFNKDGGRAVEEFKLSVVYISPKSSKGNTDDEALKGSKSSPDNNQVLQNLKEERDAAVQQTQQLQQELETLKRHRQRRSSPGFSLKSALFMALVGIIFGFLMKLCFSSPSSESVSKLHGASSSRSKLGNYSTNYAINARCFTCLLLDIGLARTDEIAWSCTLFLASLEFVESLCSIPNSSLFPYGNCFVARSPVALVAFREFIAMLLPELGLEYEE